MHAPPPRSPHLTSPSGYILFELLSRWLLLPVRRVVIALRPKFFPQHEHMLTMPSAKANVARGPASASNSPQAEQGGGGGGAGGGPGFGNGGAKATVGLGGGGGVKKRGRDATRFVPLLSRVR